MCDRPVALPPHPLSGSRSLRLVLSSAAAFCLIADGASAKTSITAKVPASAKPSAVIVVKGSGKHIPRGRRLRARLERKGRLGWRQVGKSADATTRGAFTLRWKVPSTAGVLNLRVVGSIGSKTVARTAATRLIVKRRAAATPTAGTGSSTPPGPTTTGAGPQQGGESPQPPTPPFVPLPVIDPIPDPTSVSKLSDGGAVVLNLGPVRVEAPAGAIRPGRTLSLTKGGPSGYGLSAPSVAGGPVTLTTDQGQPSLPVQLSIQYTAPLPGGGHPVLVHANDVVATWLPEPTTWDATTGVATATVNSFSSFDWANSAVYYAGLFTGNRADDPSDCIGSTPDWIQDVSLPNSREQPLPMCLAKGTDGARVVINLVNNRGYAQHITVGGTKVDVDPSKFSSSLEGLFATAFANLLPSDSPNEFLLAPGGAATLVFPRPADQPAARQVFISPRPAAPKTAYAMVAWGVAKTSLDRLGLGKIGNLGAYVNCLTAALNTVVSQPSVGNALSQTHSCTDAAATRVTDDATKDALRKIGYAIAVVDVFYKTQDLLADTAYPAQIGFTIKGTGIVNNDITVRPNYLGRIKPGQSYSMQLTASGGQAPYEFHLYRGSANGNNPPPWVSLSPSGVLTMNPPADDRAEYRFYVYAFDAKRERSPFARDFIKVATGEGSAPLTSRPSVITPSIPEATWTAPMGWAGRILPKVDGSVVTTKCTYSNPTNASVAFAPQQLGSNGSQTWRRPSDGGDCYGTVLDAAGNTYYFMGTDLGAQVRSVDPKGQVRWTSEILGHSIDRVMYASPAVGANGSVYFALYNGWGHGFLFGFDRATGAITMDRSSSFPLALFAYPAGLVTVNGYGSVDYVSYDGSDLASYRVPEIDFTRLGKVAGDSRGNIFIAGGAPGDCGPTTPNAFSVAKVTPTGVPWTWTDPGSTGCERGSGTATPDGGVALTEWRGGAAPGYVMVLTKQGHIQWRTELQPEFGQLFAGPLRVDRAGIVAIPTLGWYSCRPPGSPNWCQRLQVSFASQVSGGTRLPRVTATNEAYVLSTGGAPWNDIAIAANRLYVGASPWLDNETLPTHSDALAAFDVPGLAEDYEAFEARAITVP